jgi:hypothetical protein
VLRYARVNPDAITSRRILLEGDAHDESAASACALSVSDKRPGVHRIESSRNLSASTCFQQLTSGLPVISSKRAVTARIGDYIVSTARKRVLPSATLSYAFGASANG